MDIRVFFSTPKRKAEQASDGTQTAELGTAGQGQTGRDRESQWCKSSPEPKEDPTHAPGANADDQQSAATRRKRKQEASDDTYQALQIKDDGNDDYQVIMSTGKNKKAQAPQSLSAKTRTTAPPH
ncbi:uncharacterized protein LOC129820711 isoform X4 [Salvelinus fontinalis]|uniref:uncharacterized protein LOC129820711 isoform X4 n=1 Tax=Salvelinus fontinalis TaxID=8038 RepID=UPI002484DED9|nr:uncharacterized protein LOC129820711 isoform X4 [Salvelinus fontinalis]XP_055733578.1 uncharacterized protein LOC129820711 isoform X4 [Salvelinus fontinalis]XP_055733579.1 uncharacterized protein LOC129820711 isoform X4 [Salvelinus fontinalis]XP_055733580.1 uncharacterized protein LOC129820711 isoform X4 [Salvelinus fontinalis]